MKLFNLFNNELGSYYTKDNRLKRNFINGLIEHKKKNGLIDRVVYFCPKKFQEEVKNVLEHEVHLFFYEDITKTNEPYALASDRSLLILDGSSRYKNIATQTFKRLSRISSGYKHKFLIDIVPFTTDIKYIYLPFAYLSRSILQHQHFYAFRENNQEYFNGKLVPGHDYELLSNKIQPYVFQTYKSFFDNKIETIEVKLTPKEKQEYQDYRNELFERFDSFNPIVTRLSDFVNTRESAYQALDRLLEKLTGKAIIYTNIKTHNKPLKKRYPDYETYTFYDVNGVEKEADNIILFEIPITKSYLFLDIVSRVKPTCNIYFFKSDTPVSKLLYKQMTHEFSQINDFTKVLWRVQNEKSRKENLPR